VTSESISAAVSGREDTDCMRDRVTDATLKPPYSPVTL
jgi:hypothetical protein